MPGLFLGTVRFFLALTVLFNRTALCSFVLRLQTRCWAVPWVHLQGGILDCRTLTAVGTSSAIFTSTTLMDTC